MRICYLFNSSTPSSNPGSIQVVNTCGAIAELSHNIKLIVPNTGLKISLKKFYGLKKTPKLVKLKYFNKFPLGLNYYLFSLFSVFYGHVDKTDLYITRNFFTLFLLNLFNKKVIIEVHHDLKNEGRIVNFLYKKLSIFKNKNILKIVAITNSVKKYLIKNFDIDQNKIEIIPSASALKFKFSKIKNKKEYNIGYFGSLDSSKGSDFVIKLANKDNKNKYFIYGGTKEQVISLKKKNAKKNLQINPSIPYGALNKIISKMDILLMPSNSKKLRALGGIGNIAKYTSPLKLFDYLSSGKLIISSNLKVFHEILENKKNCIMINNLKVNNWIKVINNLNLDISMVNNLKKNAYNLSKNYTYIKRADKILNLKK
jgi:glycosyltransferase involved in cell wall biosynthesis